jgi:hypothetical protein
MNVFILSHFQSPDYLADMIMFDLIGTDGINIFTNKIPEYLFDDYLGKDNLYGKGFTLYCKLPAVDKAKINLIASCRNEPDLIIYASARRYFDSNFFKRIYRNLSHPCCGWRGRSTYCTAITKRRDNLP